MGEVAASWTRGFQFRGQTAPTSYNATSFLQGVLTLKHYVANSLENTAVQADVTVDKQYYAAGQNMNRHNVDVKISNAMLQQYLVSEHSPCSTCALSSCWMAALTSNCDQIREASGRPLRPEPRG